MIKGWIVTVKISYHELQFRFKKLMDANGFIETFIESYIGDADEPKLGNAAKYSIAPILDEHEEAADEE